jgi:hypothetical protein
MSVSSEEGVKGKLKKDSKLKIAELLAKSCLGFVVSLNPVPT